MEKRRTRLFKRIGAVLLMVVLLSSQQSCFVKADEQAAQTEAAQAETAQEDRPKGPGEALMQKKDQQAESGEAGAETSENNQSAIDPANLPELDITYCMFQNQVGWSAGVKNNRSLRARTGSYATAVRFYVEGQTENLTGMAAYQAYLTGSGWLEWVDCNAEMGNSGDSQPVESISVKLTGIVGDYYDIYYAVWQNGAWSAWSMNGTPAGTAGSGVRIEGLRAAVVVKGTPAPEMKDDVIDPSRPMVALTFDDGPSTPVTSRILDSLEANGGRATFFMVGNRVPGTKAVVQRMTALNCEVANHTYEHKYLTKIGDSGIRSQVGLTNQKIAEACGVTPTLVRPPGGYYDKASLSTLGSMGMSAIMWDIDTLDWKTRNAQNTINVVLNQVKDGDIVLMHDIYSTSADAAVVIIPELVKRGYQLVTVSELAQYRGGLKAGGVYNRFRP